MARPITAAPRDNGHAPTDVGMDPLPTPHGSPNASSPVFFAEIDPPPEAADMGLDIAMSHVPFDGFFDLG